MDPASELSKKREFYKSQITTALLEDPDPLTAYDTFVKWTLDNYRDDQLPSSGLLELLEEATRKFKDDDAYKGDLRYLKLWSLYASHVEDPAVIYAYLLANGIGLVYAQTYWEYAAVLERTGRRADAETIYKQGILRRARPTDPLKRRYEEFKLRSGSRLPPASDLSAATWKSAPPQVQALRRSPLKNHTSSSPPAATVASAASTQPTNPLGHDRYAPMLAPPAPGKRPEKLRFNLSLLFTEDGTEYSMQEARARSMGLLGKKWGPPPPSETVRVSFKEAQGPRGTRTFTARKGFTTGEPTVTLATKEALADVFGMYNSPEKSMRFGAVAGSKHAPVRKVEPVTPMSLQGQLRAVSNENANVPVKTPRGNENANPFVDENLRRENATPAVPPKFKPFVDAENPSKIPAFTPQPGRRGLSVKDSTTPASARARLDENAPSFKPRSGLKSINEESKPVFSAVFTPLASTRDRPQARRDTSGDEQAQGKNAAAAPMENGNVFTPYRDDAPVKVFSRPPTRNENAPPPPSATFRPFVDPSDEDQEPAAPARVVLGERVPLRPFSPPPIEDEEPEENMQASEDDSSYTEDEEPYDEYVEQDADFENVDGMQGEDDSMYDEQGDGTSYGAPLGGRFGQFDVMTPITERTFEFTMSTRGTPNLVGEGIAVYRDPVEAAEQLAAELREDDQQQDAGNDLSSSEPYIDERTGTLNLSDALAATSSFQPANPCNPFDPPIIASLLSLIPPDHDFHDLKREEAHQLDTLQKFAKKKSRRTSGNTTSRLPDDTDVLPINLLDREFAVVDKLGEGGFGAVFEAVDLSIARHRDDDDDDDGDGDGEDDRVALKVVKPRNLWEFYVLRRIHRTLPPHLRQSIVKPQALYAFRDESFLVLELCKQGTLLDIVNRAPHAGVTQQGACLDELLVMFFTIELMRILEGMHRAGFIHGDMKIDNCLLRLEDVPGPASAWSSMYSPDGEGGWSYKGIKLIDFGRTIDTRLFPAGQQYIAEWPTDPRDCLEIRENRPWTFQTDYFGLAGIIYCMLYGKYIEASSVVPAAPSPQGIERYKLATSMKRYWQVDLWTRLFDLLLNSCLMRSDGELPLCDEMAELRVEMETWLQANCNRASNSLKGLLKKIGIYILNGRDSR
ncbi:hypothetical protein IEO21_07133 [Rhodonia placenta]|uniref:Uncharacterized protein n=1 Tax=Rhodonia placenta TaxID=104341 RepID=A0A8H7NYQ3_9APHY|nr:hypothetical protein IEO21_07133 [Postia placenta]